MLVRFPIGGPLVGTYGSAVVTVAAVERLVWQPLLIIYDRHDTRLSGIGAIHRSPEAGISVVPGVRPQTIPTSILAGHFAICSPHLGGFVFVLSRSRVRRIFTMSSPRCSGFVFALSTSTRSATRRLLREALSTTARSGFASVIAHTRSVASFSEMPRISSIVWLRFVIFTKLSSS